MGKSEKITYLLSIILIGLILSWLILSYIVIPSMENRTAELEDGIPIINERIVERLKSINENRSELKQLQIGDEYHLYDPLYQEAQEFLENNKSYYANETIQKAKNQGLHCALADIVMGEEQFIYELISFNTVDKGLVYFETNTAYPVTPEIGESYITCVNPPYSANTFNDTITDIIIIW